MRQRVEALELVKWKELMDNQTGRKIKVLQYDHIEEYKVLSCNLARIIILLPTSQMKKCKSPRRG